MTEDFQRTNPLARGKEKETAKPLKVYVEHTEIRRQVYREIKKLYKTLIPKFGREFSLTIEKFLKCVTPLKHMHDVGRLPMYRTKSVSPIPDKRHCVWAIVSCLVQAYWKYELDDSIEKDKVLVLVLLGQLIKINEHYLEMRVTGAENTGYWLEFE